MPKPPPVTLTAGDLELCRKLGTDPKALLAHKEKEAAKLAERDEAARYETRQAIGARSPAAALSHPLLTPSELALCRQLGTDPAQVALHKIRARMKEEEQLGKRKPTTTAAPADTLALPSTLASKVLAAAKLLEIDPVELVAEALVAYLAEHGTTPAATTKLRASPPPAAPSVALATLRLALPPGDDTPGAFRIFRAGENATSKGTFVFDAEAARAVMADYARAGTDVMIDLEHLSLKPEAPNFDPDARGWAKLELRGGELWAVDVRWTHDGSERLQSKRQKYISPAFDFDQKTRRVLRLANVAITAMPATFGASSVAAAVRSGAGR